MSHFFGTRVVHAVFLLFAPRPSCPLAFTMNFTPGLCGTVPSLPIGLDLRKADLSALPAAVSFAVVAALAKKESLTALTAEQLQQRHLVVAILAFRLDHARVADVRRLDDHADAWHC
jgi:hypothetical protein